MTTTTTHPVAPGTIAQQLQWRYATKGFDPTRKVAAEVWSLLTETLRLAPSSFGLEPWKFVVVTDPDVRKKLQAASWNQAQIVDASHLVVFTYKKGVGAADVEALLANTAKARGMPREQLEGYGKMILGFLDAAGPNFDVDHWSSRQVYLALGQFLTCAAMLGVDACPMEGIDAAAYDRILGLGEQGYGTLCVATVGYRATDDKYAGLAKVRKEAAEVIAVV